MKRTRLYKLCAAIILLGLSGLAVSLVSAFRFTPNPNSDAGFIARAQQKSVPGIKVSISVLSAPESQQTFGENLAKFNIQPVWLSIQNETDDQLVFLPITMDPDFYSPYEVSYRFHGVLSLATNRARDEFFLERQISDTLPPHSTTTGFVYGVLDTGVKYAHVAIAGKGRLEGFDFALPIPGPAFVGTKLAPIGFIRIRTLRISNLILCERHLQDSLVVRQMLTAPAMVTRLTLSLYKASRIQSFLLFPEDGILPEGSMLQAQ